MASCVLLVFVKGAVADALNGHPCTIFNRSSEKFSRFVHGVQNIVADLRSGPRPVITTTAGCTSWHRAAGTAACMESIEVVGTACYPCDSRSYISASRRRDGGSALRASWQSVLPFIVTTVGRISCRAPRRWRAAAHREHRGSRYCLSSLRQWVVHHGIAPPGRRSARGASRQLVLPATATTADRTS